jgi:hypothetical protein
MAVIKRKAIAAGATAAEGAVVDATTQIIGNLQIAIGNLPAAAQQYAALVQQVATEQGVLPGILFGIGWRETLWGTAKALDVPGPSGTGDWTARGGSYLTAAGVTVISDEATFPAGWSYSGNGPWAIPEDGKGWGRGLMQIDYAASVSINWEDPYTNITQGAKIYLQKATYINARVDQLSPAELEKAAIAAYNCGQAAVVKALLAGNDVDSTTTGGNYSKDILSHIASWS